jgi:ABC-type sugar transport system substrate-binding protein
MKRQLMNRRTAMLAMSACLAGATLFGAVAQASAAPVRIAAIVQSLNSEYNVLWANAAQAHPALKDGTAQLTILDGRMDALTQSGLFDTAITDKYDAIIFIPVDIDAGNAPVQRAIAAGVPVFGSNTLITDTKLYKSYINSNDVEAGQILAKSVIDKMGGKGNVVVIEGMIGQSAQVQRLQGIQKTLADNPNVKLLEMKTANWTRAESMALTENWLTAHPGEINGIIAENDEEALGALEAVKGAGIDPKTIPIAGVDGITDALLGVKRGEMMSTLQDADAQAKGAIDLALRAVIGDSYKPRAAVWDVNGGKLAWANGAAQHYYVPWVPVTGANVDGLLAMRKTQ